MRRITRTIKGQDYTYLSYYDRNEGKMYNRYCGKANQSSTIVKACDLELKWIKGEKTALVERIKELEHERRVAKAG